MDGFVTDAVNAALKTPLDELCAHSFRNFHARGLDYLCLKRSPAITLKVYFFDGDVRGLPEVVIPHNHRYAFGSTVLSGAVRERRYAYLDSEFDGYEPHEEFDYLTPLNGGDGFHWRRTAWLRLLQEPVYRVGESYMNAPEHIHTLQIMGDGTVLFLRQYADEVLVGEPTQSYRPSGQRAAISLDGLYDEMTSDHACRLLRRLDDLTAKVSPQGDASQ